jgi:uncharacterized protein DUF932
VLAVKDEAADGLAACGGRRSLTAVRGVIRDAWAISPKHVEDLTMNTFPTAAVATHSSAFLEPLSLENVRKQAPAVFAPSAHERMSSKYTFIPTERVLTGLMQAGFLPVDARQAQSRGRSPLHARHIVRLRRRMETIQLKDSVPEIVFLNSHDGTSGYQLRVGIFRVVCTNGLIVSLGAFPGYCVSHRGNIVEEVIAAALDLSERFGSLAEQVQRMEHRRLHADEQQGFAQQALSLRYPDITLSGMQPSALLSCRRTEDVGDDLWSILNRVQENLLRGGMSRRSANGRLTRMRGITAIRQEVRINSGLWDLASGLLAA